MPLIKSGSDEARSKNIAEMIKAGHPADQAKAAAYTNQRKYKKMAAGGMVSGDYSEREDEIENELNPENHVGLYEIQERSHYPDDLSEHPEGHELLANVLARNETHGNGTVDSDIDPDETVDLPESEFAARAKKAIEARNKKKIMP